MNNIEEIAKKIRKSIFKTAYFGKTGHLASAFSIVEILSVLYFKGILKYDPANPQWKQRDKLIMSKGHASLALYSVLNIIGYLKDEELNTFCKPGSFLGGEPKLGDIPGVEATTGSLGHGLSFGLGIALSNKMNDLDSRVYVILGDGECQEGSIWEAVMSAANYKLDNLTVILDSNKLQAMGTIEDIMGIKSMNDKWKCFGWDVEEIDGHNIQQIYDALESNLQKKVKKPRIIIANTIKGKGISFMENVPIWHYRMPNEEELKIVMKELDISAEELKL